ncbi:MULTISPECIES: hypothetical protein [unclassified Sporosarcina]|uniref:hypothetical protein n=1 Tax=unclassified Sporosarcina TaxID=2647733 RepID=UPI00203ABBFC|nr:MULTISPECIES: hypothetical protein [unclassified Sporosarcina]GKV64669.1 hypothetical protein NCCP2331_08220 [Sporosarcina sp. NCCP-2331]GLB54458.1 hypothetical protein NCCP2378_02430 [Sporosarcina sp. NCCP-2378]
MQIKIYLNNGITFTANAAEYNGAAFAKAINDREAQVVAVGDLVISKHAILLVAPADVVEPVQ